MKKILFVSGLSIKPHSGGVERITHLLTTEMLSRGYEIMYLALRCEEKDNDVVYSAPQYFFPTSDVFSQDNTIFYNNFIREHQIDVVINQQCPGNESYLFLNLDPDNRKNVKVITVCHNKPLCGLDHFHKYSERKIEISAVETVKFGIKLSLFPVFRFIRKQRRKRSFQFIIKNSDHFVVYTDAYAKEISEILNRDENDISAVVIPNPNTYSYNGENNFDKKKQVLYVGRFSSNQKRPDLLLKIWRKMYKQHPDWELIFCGSGEMEKMMKHYAKKHKLQNVTFCGTVDPLPYYQQASIFAMTSIYEGFPMVLTEAMKNECVPIAFDSFAAVNDVIIPGKTGVLVRHFNLSEFSQKLSDLMADEQQRKTMAKEAMQHVKRFDISNIIEKWIRLIEK